MALRQRSRVLTQLPNGFNLGYCRRFLTMLLRFIYGTALLRIIRELS